MHENAVMQQKNLELLLLQKNCNICLSIYLSQSPPWFSVFAKRQSKDYELTVPSSNVEVRRLIGSGSSPNNAMKKGGNYSTIKLIIVGWFVGQSGGLCERTGQFCDFKVVFSYLSEERRRQVSMLVVCVLCTGYVLTCELGVCLYSSSRYLCLCLSVCTCVVDIGNVYVQRSFYDHFHNTFSRLEAILTNDVVGPIVDIIVRCC